MVGISPNGETTVECYCMSVGFREFDEEKERERLRKVSDEELIREGQAARFLCAPNQNFGKPPRIVFVVGLRLL
jgi:hypothetical protein